MNVGDRSGLRRLRSRRADFEVSVASDGVCVEQLVHDRDMPDAGARLARLYPEVSQ